MGGREGVLPRELSASEGLRGATATGAATSLHAGLLSAERPLPHQACPDPGLRRCICSLPSPSLLDSPPSPAGVPQSREGLASGPRLEAPLGYPGPARTGCHQALWSGGLSKSRLGGGRPPQGGRRRRGLKGAGAWGTEGAGAEGLPTPTQASFLEWGQICAHLGHQAQEGPPR